MSHGVMSCDPLLEDMGGASSKNARSMWTGLKSMDEPVRAHGEAHIVAR